MGNLIIDELNNIVNNKLISFHVPGHKLGKIYDRLNYINILNKIYSMDTTEILGTDNLHSPEGIIKRSQKMASKVFNSDETYYLINGSTCGIQASIMSLCPPKSKIIVNRDCHQSVINACILGDIEPVYISSKIDKNTNIIKGIDIDNAIKVIDNNLDAKAIILTYPTYYGMTYDLNIVCEYAHKKNIAVIVDEAHGAHLGLSDKLPKTALEQGADIVIQSTHKTLPSFTQSSMIHIQGNRVNKEQLVSILKIIESSSPSYILMASLEIAVDIYNKYGIKLMNELLNNIDKLKKSFNKNNGIEFYDTDDKTKVFISAINMGLIGYELETILRQEYNIQVELSNYYGALLICTIGNDDEDFKNLEIALNEISKKYKSNKNIEKIDYPNNIPIKKLTPREAFYKEKKSVKIYESVGKVSGEYIIPYPPGISIISPGEIITKDVIDYILFCKEKGMNVSGLKDSNLGQIQIIE